jgi:hypothetical protein
MNRQPAPTPLDPALDSALLLRRIGFAILALALPLISLLSRRAAVLLVPIGVVLLVIAALIENPGWFFATFRRSVMGPAGLAVFGLAGWAILSLVWSPYTGSASEKAANLVLAVGLGFAGAAALPERMRASNLNLVALGTGLAAILVLVLMAVGAIRAPEATESGVDAGSVERGVSVLLIMVWPALAWLLSRERSFSALGLATVVSVVALMRFEDGEIIAMLCGVVAFGAVAANRRIAVKVIAAVIAGAMLLAPMLPFLLLPVIRALPTISSEAAASLDVWADIVGSDPLLLITGHGLDTVLRGRTTGVLPVETPFTLLFETWYELGLVGAAAASFCLYFAVLSAGRMPGPLGAGGVAAYATAFTLAAFGFATLQTWWLMTMVAVALLFTAIARGQYRTERPRVPGLTRREREPAGTAG